MVEPIGIIRSVKIHYRQAKLYGGDDQSLSLQEMLMRTMQGDLGKDSNARIFPMASDTHHQGCLNYCEQKPLFFVADIMHLDGRTTLPRWIKPTEPRPVAEIVPREVADSEASLGEPVYIMVSGNHLAAIERIGFRTTNLTFYLNQLLAKSGLLAEGLEWRLIPKIEVTAGTFDGKGVKKIFVKPHAAVVGHAPSLIAEDGKKRRARRAASAFEDLAVFGERVLNALVAFGADEAKLDKLREAMSADLAIKAKLELSIANVRKRTTAEISEDTVNQALAELANDGEVTIVSEGSRKSGKMTQLVETAEILEQGGLIVWGRAVQALSSAINAWAAKGVIVLAE